MGTKTQTTKNIDLSYKLMDYLVNGEDVPVLPQDVSFVPFSKTDKKLNAANEKLLEVIFEEDKPVARAEEPQTKKEPWKIIPVNF